MPQKICVISFDHWNYDKYIVDTLNKKGIDSFHINIGNFKYKNIWARFCNAFSKVFFNKNIKNKKRQEDILNKLNKKQKQDQILVINPELIDLEYHLEIKKYTKKYIAYLYDSVDRNPVHHLLTGIFDEIYSFDKKDVEKYNFKKITNYIYIQKQPIENNEIIQNDIFYLASYDGRVKKLCVLANFFSRINVDFKFIVVGKKVLLKKISKFFFNKFKNIDLRIKRVEFEDLKKLYKQTNVVLDLVRNKQTGLSFRIFEAMAFQKKIITNNKTIMEYDFYNPNNILVIGNKKQNITKIFFETKYEPIDETIYYKYTIENWVDCVFNLK